MITNNQVPTDWREFSLGDLLNFSNGINADKSAYGHGVPFANVLEVITHEALSVDDIPGLVRLPEQIMSRYRVKRGDILFNRTSETQDEVGLSSVYLDDAPIVFGGFVFRGRPTGFEMDVDFSKYVLRGQAVRQQIITRGQGGIRANIGQRDLKSVRVQLPGRAEQRAIAAALDDASRLIRRLEQTIAKKQAIKQGMMQQLLTGETRLSGFTEAWSEGTFEQLAVPSKERAMPQNVPSTTPLVELDQIEGGSGRLIGKSQASDAISLKAVFRPGDVLFGKLRAYLRKFWYADVAGLCTTEIWVLRPKAGVDGRFVRFIVETDNFIEAASGAYGTHMPRSDWGTVGGLPVRIPSLDEQTAISSTLADLDTEISLLHIRLAKARSVKQGMMQQLLAGRTRLPVRESTE